MGLEIADRYEQEVELEKQFQEEKRKQIKALEKLIVSSIHRPIYEFLYESKYGDFREYANKVASELRQRDYKRRKK